MAVGLDVVAAWWISIQVGKVRLVIQGVGSLDDREARAKSRVCPSSGEPVDLNSTPARKVDIDPTWEGPTGDDDGWLAGWLAGGGGLDDFKSRDFPSRQTEVISTHAKA